MATQILRAVDFSVHGFLLDKLGIVQNLAQTTAPSLISVIGLGVIHQTMAVGLNTLADRVKNRWEISEEQILGKGIDALQFVSVLATRYLVARVFNLVFGCKISTRYVHIYTALDVIEKGCLISPSSLCLLGLLQMIDIKIFSLFTAARIPLRNAFYLGMIYMVLSSPVQLIEQKICSQIRWLGFGEDSGLPFIFSASLIYILSCTAFACSVEISNRYFNLQLSKDVVTVYAIFNATSAVVNQCFGLDEERKRKAPLNFILDEVLKEASFSTKKAVVEVNIEKETVNFFLTKAVAIYVVGSKKGESVPAFFSEDTRKKVMELRAEIRGNQSLQNDYQKILNYLDRATREEGDEEQSFFNFSDQFEENSSLKQALNSLRGIGYGELSKPFCTRFYFLACEELKRREPRLLE